MYSISLSVSLNPHDRTVRWVRLCLFGDEKTEESVSYCWQVPELESELEFSKAMSVRSYNPSSSSATQAGTCE